MDADEARNRLAEERARLALIQADLGAVHDEAETDSLGELSSVAQHEADLASETFDREQDLSILADIEAELADVERALARLDEGTYGTCEACGAAVGDERLEALPATRFCVNDQVAAERERLERGAGAPPR